MGVQTCGLHAGLAAVRLVCRLYMLSVFCCLKQTVQAARAWQERLLATILLWVKVQRNMAYLEETHQVRGGWPQHSFLARQ